MTPAVQILDGAFKGMPAVLERVEGTQVHVLVTVFGRQVPVALSPDQVNLPAQALDLEQALAERYARWHAQQLRDWWSARAEAPEGGDLEALAQWRPTPSLPELQQALLRASTDWPPAAHTQFEAWGTEHLPLQAWPDHPLVEQAIAEGRVTGSGTPKLSAAQWRVARAAEAAGRARQERAWRQAWLRSAGPPSTSEDRTQHRERLQRSASQHQARFRSVWGLELPQHALEFWALWQAASPMERALLERSGLRFGGLFDALANPESPPDLDGRLHDRCYQAPPHFIPCAWGDTDGLHWGLWYDRDHSTPVVAGFYARDGGGGFVVGGRLTDLVRERASIIGQPSPGLSARENCRRRLQEELLLDLAKAFDTAAPAVDRGLETLDGFGLRGVDLTGIPEDRLQASDAWTSIRDDPTQTALWEAQAQAQLAQGHPAFALLMGRDLHWLSLGDPERERRAAALLQGAYAALGDASLAGIAAAHAAARGAGAHRAFPSAALEPR